MINVESNGADLVYVNVTFSFWSMDISLLDLNNELLCVYKTYYCIVRVKVK